VKVLSILLIPLLLVPSAFAKYGGTGEPNDPYQIATAEDLMLLGESPEDYDKHFILTADIDLDPNLPGRKVFDKAIIETKICFAQGCKHWRSPIIVEKPCIRRIIRLT
jgi:hypothetical protein